jgi:hypothetical protein
MDKAKHGEASYPQLISDAKYNRAESDAVEGNCVVRADGDHNTLNRGDFLVITVEMAALIIRLA